MKISTLWRTVIRCNILLFSSQIFSGKFDNAEALYNTSQFSKATLKFEKIFEKENINPLTHTDDPELIRVITNYAESVLGAHDYQNGFVFFDARLYNGQQNRTPLQNPWDGKNPEGQTIVVRAEHGLGDTFMFSRYLKELKKHNAHVVFVPQRPLRELYKQINYVDEVRETTEINDGEYDIYLISLTRYLSSQGMEPTKIYSIPSNIPYLYSKPTYVAEWKELLESQDDEPTIGLCWRTSQNAAGEYRFLKRDIPLNHIMGTLQKVDKHFKCISLQGGGHRPIMFEELTELKNIDKKTLDQTDAIGTIKDFIQINDFDEAHGPFMDTCALAQAMAETHMGIIISVDTSVAHIAAAAGAETHLLLPKESDWRWGECPSNPTPWYPQNVHIYQQKSQDDWQAPLKKLKHYLQKKYDIKKR